MKTIRVREMIGEDMVTVTHTKQGHILIHVTDIAGETEYMSERAFIVQERETALIRQMIDRAREEGNR